MQSEEEELELVSAGLCLKGVEKDVESTDSECFYLTSVPVVTQAFVTKHCPSALSNETSRWEYGI